MKTGFITIGLLLLLVCLPISVPATKANIVTNEKITAAYQPYIITPSNMVYCSNVLTLNVSFRSEVWGNVKYTMVYSLDGQENKSLPLTDHYFSWVQGLHNKCYDDGLVTLPELSDGSHNITVYLQCDWVIGESIGDVDYYYNDSQTVFFKVETTIPEISTSLQNKTYSSNDILLNLTLNKPMSKITYSLDGQENVTISGEITLKGLSNGEHNLVAYAEDNSSFVGTSEKIYFRVENYSMVTLDVTALIIIAFAVTAVLLVYFKKRKVV